MFSKGQISGLAAGIALGVMAAVPASAMDVASVKAHDKPALESTQAAQVCAASFTAKAYLAPAGSDEQKGALTFAKAWVSVAAKASGKTYAEYRDNVVTNDMQALYDAGDDTVKFYSDYCLLATKQLMN